MDELGIRRLASFTPPGYQQSQHNLTTKQNGDILREAGLATAAKLNSAVKTILPTASFDCSFYDDEDDRRLCMDPGRREYLRRHHGGKPPVLITDMLSDTLADNLKVFLGLSKSKGLREMAFNKDTQSGKTLELTHMAVLFSLVNEALTGVYTRPLLLLTAEHDTEQQMLADWRTFIGILGPMRFTLGNKRGTSVDEYVKPWCYGDITKHYWLRRVSSNLRLFVARMSESLLNHEHVILLLDEADKGLGATGTLRRWFDADLGNGISFHKLVNDKSQFITFINSSATNYPFMAGSDQKVKIFSPNDASYTHWCDMPMLSFKEYGDKYGVPHLYRLATTCHAGTSPLGEGGSSRHAFVKAWCKPKAVQHDDDQFLAMSPNRPYPWTSRELKTIWTSGESNLFPTVEWLTQNHDNFRENVAPQMMADLITNVMASADAPKMIILRCLLNNNLTKDLIDRIRTRPGFRNDEIIIVPYFGVSDVVNGEPISYVKDETTKAGLDMVAAVEKAFRIRGLEPYSKPVVMFVTNAGRRGTRFPNVKLHYLQFTASPVNKTSMIQANGRIGGYNHKALGSMLVFTQSHMKQIARFKAGTSRLPDSPYVVWRGKSGRPNRTLYIYKDAAKKCPWLLPLFRRIEVELLNQPWQIKKLRTMFQWVGDELVKVTDRGQPKGGMDLIRGGKPLTPCLGSIITPAVMERIEKEHAKLFTAEDGEPIYDTIRLLKFAPGLPPDRQPKGIMMEDGQHEQYHCDSTGNYFYHGLRLGVTTNLAARKANNRQQPQVHYIWDGERMSLAYVALRLTDTPVYRGEKAVPVKDTPPYILGTPEEQTLWDEQHDRKSKHKLVEAV